MARYIDADKIKKFVADMKEEVPYEWAWTLTALDKAPTENVMPVEWISVKDRLPEEKDRVLVFLKQSGHTKGYTRIDTDRLIKGNWIRWGSCVTHWMPLPEPPKKEGADNGN